MKLIHTDYNIKMIFREGKVNRIIIESPEIMRNFITDFINLEKGVKKNVILSKDHMEIEFSKNCELILDYFRLDINSKKVIKNIYEQIEKEIQNSELFLIWQEIIAKIEVVILGATNNLDISIDDNKLLDIQKILKNKDIKLNIMNENLVDILLEYFQFMNKWIGIKMFVLINPANFFTKEEIEGIYEHSFLYKYFLLLIDKEYVEIKKDKEKTFILDEDYCIISI